MAMGSHVWVLLRACGVPWASHPWHAVPSIHVPTPSLMCSVLGDAHTPCLHNARVWDTGGWPRDRGNPCWVYQAAAGAGTLREVTWGQPVASASLQWLCFPCWKSHPGVAVPVNATVVVVPVSATGHCAPPSSLPPLTNHLQLN